MVGGDVVGGEVVGGDVVGGVIGGVVAGGDVVDGDVVGGAVAGGLVAGGDVAGVRVGWVVALLGFTPPEPGLAGVLPDPPAAGVDDEVDVPGPGSMTLPKGPRRFQLGMDVPFV